MGEQAAGEGTTSNSEERSLPDRRRLRELVRAYINFADTNNDGRLSVDEAHRIFPAIDQNTSAVLSDAVRGLAQQNLRNMEGMPEPATGLSTLPLVRPEIRMSTIIDNVTVYDRSIAIQRLATQFALPPAEIDRILHDVLPHGIEEIRLSDECARHPEAPCSAIDGQRVLIHLLPASRS